MHKDVSQFYLGFVGVAAVSPKVEIANPQRNVDYILECLDSPETRNCQIVVFPELSVTGYTCGDLFFQSPLLVQAMEQISRLAERMDGDPRLVAVGAPLVFKGSLYNCAILLCNGEILAAVPKINIPNYQEFYEKRWFRSGRDIRNRKILVGNVSVPFSTNLIIDYLGVKIGVEICEDLWVPNPPSSLLSQGGAEVILNLSATDDNIGKYGYIRSLVASQSGRCRCAYAYASSGNGESSTDLVFSGIDLIAFDGAVVASSRRFPDNDSHTVAFIDVEKIRNERMKFSTFYPDGDCAAEFETIVATPGESPVLSLEDSDIYVDPNPFVPSDVSKLNEHCTEIVEIQSWGLSRRLKALNCRDIVVGISGGLDSTLALLVAHYAFRRLGFDLKGILGVTMPSLATSDRTHNNAAQLMQKLGVSFLEIPVKEAVDLHFSQIGHDPKVFDAVYENSQARERTQILMDLANKTGGIVLGTGDLSELALGWCTYNGDHMSMYNVNAGVPKTLVRHLVSWFAATTDDEGLRAVLEDIVDTPISPELIPAKAGNEIAQLTEKLVGPYELHDFFLFHMLRNGFGATKIFNLARKAFGEKYPPEIIKHWLMKFYHRFFTQQFKRSCMPDGPKIGSVCLSPRGDWRMPSDASAKLWIAETEKIEV